MLDNCENCSAGGLCKLTAPTSRDDSGSDSDSDNSSFVTFYRWGTPDKHVTKVQIREPFEDAASRFKQSIVTLKSHIYTKRSQNQHYKEIKESLNFGQILVHVDYAESYKNSQQNEIQSAYFGNSTFSIFTACCYTKPYGDDKMKKDSVVVISESKEHDCAAAISCLKKVVEKVEDINETSYNKVFVWINGCAAQFRSRFVFRLITENLFMGADLVWNYDEKSHGKGPIDGVGGTVKSIVFRKVQSGFTTIHTPLEFHQAVKKFVPSIHSV